MRLERWDESNCELISLETTSRLDQRGVGTLERWKQSLAYLSEVALQFAFLRYFLHRLVWLCLCTAQLASYSEIAFSFTTENMLSMRTWRAHFQNNSIPSFIFLKRLLPSFLFLRGARNLIYLHTFFILSLSALRHDTIMWKKYLFNELQPLLW